MVPQHLVSRPIKSRGPQILNEPAIGRLDVFAPLNARSLTQRRYPADIQQLPGAPIEFVSNSDIDQFLALVLLHEEHTGVGEIVDVQKLPPPRARTRNRQDAPTQGAAERQASARRSSSPETAAYSRGDDVGVDHVSNSGQLRHFTT